MGIFTDELWIEYETLIKLDYSVVNVDIRFKRGFFFANIVDSFSESLIQDTNVALYNGPAKGRKRIIFDPDESMSAGISFLSPIGEEPTIPTFPAPKADSTVANDNLFKKDGTGWGHNWSFDFSN